MPHSEVVLGRTTLPLQVRLTPGDPFTVVLVRFDAPPGTPGRLPLNWDTAPVLEFPEAQVPDWVSTISGNEATWSVPEEDVDTLIATRAKRAVLTVGGIVWATGAWKVVS